MSRFPILLPVLLLALGGASGRLAAQTPAGSGEAPELPPMYRVEAIVFLHEGGLSDRVRAAEPADFRAALAPALAAEAVEAARFMLDHARRATGLTPSSPPGSTDAPDAPRPYLVADDERIEPVPWPYTAQPALSAPMQRALDRLQRAAEYRPLAWQAWFQGAESFRRTAEVRLHGDEVIDEVRIPTIGEALPFFPDTLRIPTAGRAGEAPRALELFTPRPAMPLFRLDGTLRLFRRQFLHAAPTLVWHDPDTGLAAPPAGFAGPDTVESNGWLLHRLEQSRVIRPGRLEYFDSSRIGVLLRITEFEHLVPPQPEAESVPESNPEADPEATRAPAQAAPAGANRAG